MFFFSLGKKLINVKSKISLSQHTKIEIKITIAVLPGVITGLNKPSMGQEHPQEMAMQCFRSKLITIEVKSSTLINFRTGMIGATFSRPND